MLMIQTILRAEIGDAALGGNTGAAEKDNASGLIDEFLKFHFNTSRKG